MSLDLNSLTPDIIQKLLDLVNSPQGTAAMRSPVRKPLTNLNMPQSARDRLHRPHFEWSADAPPEGVTIPPFPRLYWDRHGREIRVESGEDLMTRDTTGWTDAPPLGKALTPAELVQAEFDSLSDEDKQLVLTATKQAKLGRIQEAMGQLNPAELSAITMKPQPVVAQAEAQSREDALRAENAAKEDALRKSARKAS